MKSIRVYGCECGEDVFEDDKIEGLPEIRCINCARVVDPSKLKYEEIIDITHEEKT